MLSQSGGLFEASGYAAPCEVSRPTIANYLAVLEATHLVHVLRPFSMRRAREIVSAPKVYGFDTGFVCALKGWDRLRPDDMGFLWEHLTLNELQARRGSAPILYWRDKRGHEVDFVIARRGRAPTAIECKWSADRFDPRSLRSFRQAYPNGKNYLVAHDVERTHARRFGEIEVTLTSLRVLPDMLEKE